MAAFCERLQQLYANLIRRPSDMHVSMIPDINCMPLSCSTRALNRVNAVQSIALTEKSKEQAKPLDKRPRSRLALPAQRKAAKQKTNTSTHWTLFTEIDQINSFFSLSRITHISSINHTIGIDIGWSYFRDDLFWSLCSRSTEFYARTKNVYSCLCSCRCSSDGNKICFIMRNLSLSRDLCGWCFSTWFSRFIHSRLENVRSSHSICIILY